MQTAFYITRTCLPSSSQACRSKEAITGAWQEEAAAFSLLLKCLPLIKKLQCSTAGTLRELSLCLDLSRSPGSSSSSLNMATGGSDGSTGGELHGAYCGVDGSSRKELIVGRRTGDKKLEGIVKKKLFNCVA